LLDKYGSVQQMLEDTFSDIVVPHLGNSLQTYAFLIPLCIATAIKPGKGQKAGHWADAENRKQFLLDFAEKAGFDASIADNWKGTTPKLEKSQVKVEYLSIERLTSPFYLY